MKKNQIKYFLLTKEWLYEKYCILGLSANKIAKIVGLKTGNSILQRLKIFDINIRTKTENFSGDRNPSYGKPLTKEIKEKISQAKTKHTITKEWLFEQYWIKGLSTTEIANVLGYRSGKTIVKHMRMLGLSIRDISSRSRKTRFDETVLTKELLYNLYWIENKSSTDISKLLNVSNVTVLNYMDKLGIPKRSPSERKQGQLNPCYGKIGEKNPLYGKPRTEEVMLRVKASMPRGPEHFRWKPPEERIEPINNQIRNSQKAKEWKLAVLKRDQYKCVLCGSKDKLEIDHIVPFSVLKKRYNIKTLNEAVACAEFWNIDNGRALCYRCHKETETYGNKKVQK